jgi:AraC-like DNA-binding protein
MSPIRRTATDEPFMLIRTLGARMPAHSDTGRHGHAWGQLIYCSAGVMTVWTESGSWVAPPRWAIWAPAGVEHGIRFAGKAELRTLYLRADLAGGLPAACAVLTVSPLLRELILRAVDIGMLDEREPLDAAMARIIVSELATVDRPPFDLPTPASAATQKAAAILTAGSDRGGTRRVAEAVGLSTRTLERRFVSETGMSVANWGRQARLLQSLRLLAAGDSVKSVATAAGYRTPSAFVAAFRAVFGETPARYFI